MRHRSLVGTWQSVLLIAAVGTASAGCAAKVDQEVFDREVQAIRSELDDLDGRVSANRGDIQTLNQRLDALEGDLRTLQEEFQVAVERFETGIRFATPVHFEFDRAEIRTADEPLLDRFASIVAKHYEGAVITVEGFADPVGPAAYNQRLSERRAGAVADHLVSAGELPRSGIRTVGYGEDRQVRPGAGGPGADGLENRRVTFVIEYAPEPGPLADASIGEETT